VRPPGPTPPLRVWDLSTRLFHWSLALCVLAACLSAHADGELALRVHFLAGYAVLALALFRVLWGFAGSQYARFDHFVRGPVATWRYARALLGAGPPAAAAPGHNPLGAWSILAMLAACLLQAASGLYTRDDIASEGPLAQLVAEAAVRRAGALHALGEPVLYALLALHVAAIAWYRHFRGEDLLGAMIRGARSAPAQAGAAAAIAQADGARLRARALVLLLCAVALVAYAVHLTA
jgi:cytochrome b